MGGGDVLYIQIRRDNANQPAVLCRLSTHVYCNVNEPAGSEFTPVQSFLYQLAVF